MNKNNGVAIFLAKATLVLYGVLEFLKIEELSNVAKVLKSE
jgi:hypothetical protein